MLRQGAPGIGPSGSSLLRVWSLMNLSSLRRYNLGPNGGILTALNLFTTKFDQVLSILERRANEVE